jgi:hypothetical protein
VANLRRENGEGVLEAGSDVFPDDPRPVAFARDARLRDGEVHAIVTRPGDGPGVVVRRTRHRTYYAAVWDRTAEELVLLRRLPGSVEVLGTAAARLGPAPYSLRLRADGAAPTTLSAVIASADGRSATVRATDGHRALQRAGDAGVTAKANTYLTTVEERFAPFGNARLALFGLQEGEAANPLTGNYTARVREASTTAFREITIAPARRPLGRSRPDVVATSTGVPRRGGARLHVATDLPARVVVEWSYSPRFRRARRSRPVRTGPHGGATVTLRRLRPGRTVYWRPRIFRRGVGRVGPVKSFKVMPRPGSGDRVTLAVAACGSNFGSNFDLIAERAPDVFVWEGDLNYPDTHGPLAQSDSGYAGIWRDFLRNPRTAPILDRAPFACQRDDHDYGLQDTNAVDRKPRPYGIGPWDALMNGQMYYRFAAGLADVWVLDQRRFKSKPDDPDTPAKTLLGPEQRRWLMDGLAASRAPFKIVCSPVTLYYGDNERDGNWGSGFNAERDLLLAHIRARVSGRTVFLTGDSHDTMVYDRDGVFEARACPVSIPEPRDHPALIGFGGIAEGYASPGVVYADPRNHFTWIDVRAEGGTPVLDLALVAEDGEVAYTKRFTG